MKKGFTLAEMLITIAIVGILAAICMPMVRKVMPNKELLMFRKGYYLTERIVAELINDEDLYPEIYDEDGDATDNGQYLANTEEVTYKGKTYSGNTKFCELFAAKLNKTSNEVSCGTYLDNGGTLTTTDGMVWHIPITPFNIEAAIEFDVNGEKGPNSFTADKPDRFQVIVKPDGSMRVRGDVANEYLQKKNITNVEDED